MLFYAGQTRRHAVLQTGRGVAALVRRGALSDAEVGRSVGGARVVARFRDAAPSSRSRASSLSPHQRPAPSVGSAPVQAASVDEDSRWTVRGRARCDVSSCARVRRGGRCSRDLAALPPASPLVSLPLPTRVPRRVGVSRRSPRTGARDPRSRGAAVAALLGRDALARPALS